MTQEEELKLREVGRIAQFRKKRVGEVNLCNLNQW